MFAGGLSWDTTNDGFRLFFARFGEVLEAVVLRDKITGTSRGFGFVTFDDEEAREACIKASQAGELELDGRSVDVKPAVPQEQIHADDKVRTKKIFVGGLSGEAGDDALRDHFSQFGTVVDVLLMVNRDTRRSRGFGFVSFDSEAAVEAAITNAPHIIAGKPVECRRALPKRSRPRGGSNGHNHNHNGARAGGKGGWSRSRQINGYRRGGGHGKYSGAHVVHMNGGMVGYSVGLMAEAYGGYGQHGYHAQAGYFPTHGGHEGRDRSGSYGSYDLAYGYNFSPNEAAGFYAGTSPPAGNFSFAAYQQYPVRGYQFAVPAAVVGQQHLQQQQQKSQQQQ